MRAVVIGSHGEPDVLEVRDVPDLFARDDDQVQLPEIDGAGGDEEYGTAESDDPDAAPTSAVSKRAREMLLALGHGERDKEGRTAELDPHARTRGHG